MSEIKARDKHTVEFKLAEPRPVNFIMSSIASGWNVIVRKKTLEDNNYNLRRVALYPGTGPYTHTRRVENELWAFEKQQELLEQGPAAISTGWSSTTRCRSHRRWRRRSCPTASTMCRVTDPGTLRRAKATPGMSATDYYQSVIQAAWPNNKRKPYDDPRVRRAIHLVFDKPVLIEVVKDLAPMMMGGFIYPFSEFATPKEELVKRLGYQADPDRGDQGGEGADGGSGLCRRPEGPGFCWSATSPA